MGDFGNIFIKDEKIWFLLIGLKFDGIGMIVVIGKFCGNNVE